ncbi:MAG: FAD-dependent oxidoreductase, partial [Verrucomicrobiae bacterium]|nr:FAD-dependent oxidoreductase [Verrucomicrobiae bacterium]
GWRLSIATRGGIQTTDAATLVDASGDAVVAGFLSIETVMMQANLLQRPAYVFGVCRPRSAEDHDPLLTAGRIVEGVRSGEVPDEALGLVFRASGRPWEMFGTIDLPGPADGGYDPLDPSCLGELERVGRAVATAAVRWLARKDPSWADAYISHWPLRAGVRESRRWRGEATLTGDDLLQSRRFDDETALATWPMEFRENTRGPRLRFPHTDDPCGIPAGCLKPAGMDRLFVAGRCISTDHDAQASIRVMGTCFATGEAAGTMAAAASGGSA